MWPLCKESAYRYLLLTTTTNDVLMSVVVRQAVVTEFLICYTDLIFCDHLPHLIADGGAGCVGIVVTDDQQLTIPSPKRSRPKSLAISTPTKLITLEEARTKHQIVKGEECGYIEVGGGPKNLPKKYHTVLELPSGNFFFIYLFNSILLSFLLLSIRCAFFFFLFLFSNLTRSSG